MKITAFIWPFTLNRKKSYYFDWKFFSNLGGTVIKRWTEEELTYSLVDYDCTLSIIVTSPGFVLIEDADLSLVA